MGWCVFGFGWRGKRNAGGRTINSSQIPNVMELVEKERIEARKKKKRNRNRQGRGDHEKDKNRETSG